MKRALLAIATLGLCLTSCTSRPGGPQAIRIWHWMTDREAAFNELAQRYTKERGVAVRFELYAPSDVYVQKIRAAAQTGGLPEIFGVLGESRDLASFIQAGHILPLTGAMEADGGVWRMSFFPKALEMNVLTEDNPYGVAPGIYGVPIDVMNLQIFYNTRLLAQMGLDPEAPPTSWEAFLQVGSRLPEGVVGFVSGWAELWLIDCLASSYAVHLMGTKKVAATYRGKVPYTDPDWIKVLSLFEQLRDSGLLAEGIVTMVNKRAEQLFANEQAVFALNGTWGVNVYRRMTPDLKYGVMMPPTLKNRPMVTWGGAGSSFFVNARSPRTEEALAFLQWLTEEPQQRYLLEATQNIPANRAAAASLSGALAAFADDMDATIHPRLFPVQEESTVIEAFDKGIQSIVIGEATPPQVAEQVESVKRRALARQTNGEPAHATP